MFNAFIIILGGMGLVTILEKIYPNKNIKKNKNWLIRSIIVNLMQLLIVMIGSYTWEKLLMTKSIFKLSNHLNDFNGGILAYIISTWVFYWYHYIRHENNFLWLYIHQMHHTPKKMQVLTSFYKHPLEIIINSIIITTLVYPILGLNNEANLWLSMFSAFSEFFYHMNIKTPYFIGYFIQRPESHRFHHKRDTIHCCNYGDIPIWDILNNTFFNPKDEDCKIGFSNNKEEDIENILKGKDMLNKIKNIKIDYVLIFLLVIGSLSTFGVVYDNNIMKGIGFASSASPNPLVFSAFNGVETFSTKFDLKILLKNNTVVNFELDRQYYGKLSGPYNRKNIYGAMFTHGPFFEGDFIDMRNKLLKRGICGGSVGIDFGFGNNIKNVEIEIRSKTINRENDLWVININC
jgi:sterol desaturase/sphingolipid hydroxylase (fatty acid hydroxylase superfamily)